MSLGPKAMFLPEQGTESSEKLVLSDGALSGVMEPFGDGWIPELSDGSLS